ncbi:hypothetical protein RJ55_07105 [Drechmeria coniospora]|nr:hypothetical protein RJ55_07105 [Drechmeria coniospora]
MPVVGIIFDFFGAQDLAHLHNEEGYESPRFLQELSRSPTLDVEPNDKCYHIFLKLVGLSIRRLREVGAINDIRNLVVRTTPNHNRQHLKEQNVHTRDLAALRNHHDLLATLFWASPAELRPKVSQIEDLVNPESSHKEACLINIRSWGQLARFVVAAGEATTSFRPFSRWRNVFFQRVLRQLDSVASDVQQQVLSLSKDANNTISEVLINDTVSRNRAAVMDVVYASVSESFHVMREAVDLESASFSMNMPQLQSVFRKFCISQPELDWAILRAALDTLDSFLDRVDEFRENEESQQSESRILHSAQADDALMNLEHELSATFFLMARSLLSSQDERMASPITRKSKSDCLEHMVMLAARLGSMLSSSGAMELPDMFAAGRYGLFDGPAHKLDLSQRHYLVLFLQTLLKHDPGSLFDASFNLIELWALALVKPREFLGYENKLAQQLHRSGANFVPDGVVGLTVTPAYSTNRDMLEFAVSQMRRSIRDAGPSRRQGLMEKHSKTLQLLMEQIKGDLHITSLDASGHHSYVIFIQSVVSLIKAHGSEIRPVDNFFYQVSKEYSPSVQDPQLHVAGLVSYGLRLLEGDTRSGQQLFYLLHSNLKFAMINDKLRQEVIMLKSGMKNRGISNFILGKMMPAVIRATFNNSSAFPIMDVYAKLLSLHLAGKTAPYEMGADDLPNIAVILRASMEGMGSWGRHDMMLSAANVHFLRQLIAVLNLLWPSIDVMSWSVDVSSPDWKEISKSCEMMQKILTNADGYLDGLLNAGTSLNTAASKLLLRGSSHSPSHQFGSDIRMFTDNIVEDIAKNWVVSTHRIIIQTPAGSRGREAAQGMAMPSWDMTRLLRDLQGRTRGWCSWWERVFGNSPCGQWNMPESPLF